MNVSIVALVSKKQKRKSEKKLHQKIKHKNKLLWKKEKKNTPKTKLKNKLFRKTEIITLKYKPKHKLLRQNRFFFSSECNTLP